MQCKVNDILQQMTAILPSLLSSCRLLKPSSQTCEPLVLSREPYWLTVAPYLSELAFTGPLGWSRSSLHERSSHWRRATENQMRELPRIEAWVTFLQEELRDVAMSLIHLEDFGVAAFDRSDPQRFVTSHWDMLAAVNVVATHKYVIVPLLKRCKAYTVWQAFEESKKVANGAVLATTWVRDGVAKKIYFVRHCLSCANFLKGHNKQFGFKATMCLNMDAIKAARCTLHEALEKDFSGRDFSKVRLFSSGQPRAMQTALALVSDALSTARLTELAAASPMYTDCGDEQFKELLQAARA